MTSGDINYILSYWNRFRWYIFSPEVLQNQTYPEAMQKAARDFSVVVPEFSGHQMQNCRGHRSQRPQIQVLQARSCSQPAWIRNKRESMRDFSNMIQPTSVRNQSESMQNFSNMNHPTCIRNQWESMQNFSNMNHPTCIRNQSESLQDFSNMNDPTYIRNQWESMQNFLKHESANMNQKPCASNQNIKNKTCRQLNKTKAPVPDQQSSTSRSDAHIRASLFLFMAALLSWLRGGGFRQSRCQFTCREARRNHPNQTQSKKGCQQTNKQKKVPTNKHTKKLS